MARHEPLRSPPPTPEEREAQRRDQAERIASGRSRQGWIALNSPGRRTAFIAGLAGIIFLALILGALV